MNRRIYPVLSGAITHERHLELLAHNLANIHTAGFKKDEVVFGTILARVPGPSVAGMDLFPEVAMVRPDTSQGTLRNTGHDLDVALEGDGFLVVSTPSGLRHFRGGSLRVNQNGELATHAGDPVLGRGGPIELAPGQITINQSGTVRVDGKEVGQLRIERVPSSTVPVKAGNLYWVPPDRPEEATGVIVHQGFLELSNVNPSMELIDMIQVTRGYEQMQKAIQAMDELTGQIIQSSRLKG